MHNRSLAGKCRTIISLGLWQENIEFAYCSQWKRVIGSCSPFLFLTRDVASAMFCSRLRQTPSPTLAFIGSPLHYINGVFDITACHEEIDVF
jgi:hypothetical protein